MQVIKAMDKSVVKSYLGFLLHGFMVLSIGVVIPDLINNFNLGFAYAGFLLSMFSFGQLSANFVFPYVLDKVDFKISSILFTMLIPLGFFSIIILPEVYKSGLPIIFFIIGIGAGSNNIVANTVVNDLSKDKTAGINLLHTSFAIGALLAPFVIVSLKKLGLSFNLVILFLVFAMSVLLLLFTSIDYKYTAIIEDEDKENDKKLDIYFISIAFVLFFYLGIENSINGWLMTYLQSLNILSETFSASLVSLTWIMILIGRIFTASISNRIKGVKLVVIYALGVGISLFTLITSRNAYLILTSVLLLGFFLAGIYPTSVSNASAYVKNKPKRLAMLFTSASLGAMISLQLIGWVADKTSVVLAINVLFINVVALIMFAFVTYSYSKRK